MILNFNTAQRHNRSTDFIAMALCPLPYAVKGQAPAGSNFIQFYESCSQFELSVPHLVGKG
jgi:hypothetical protein